MQLQLFVDHIQFDQLFGWDEEQECLVFLHNGEPVGHLDVRAAITVAILEGVHKDGND